MTLSPPALGDDMCGIATCVVRSHVLCVVRSAGPSTPINGMVRVGLLAGQLPSVSPRVALGGRSRRRRRCNVVD